MVWPFSTPYPTFGIPFLKPEYDYIIVGGGTGGCVLANRLSRDHGVSVLLVERGDAADGFSHRNPLMSQYWASDGRHGMEVESLPNAHLGDRKVTKLTTGLGLGGTSRINSMVYTRGSPGEYNLWAQEGRHGWSFRDVEPFFLKSQHWLGDISHDHQGTHGEWQVRRHEKIYFKPSAYAAKAATDLGFAYVDDINSPSEPSVGSFKTHYTLDSSGHRHSTFRAFLPMDLALDRKERLHICVKSLASKLLLTERADHDLLCTGVRVQSVTNVSVWCDIRAKREVILAAGALRTPQILMLSGIGPENHLNKMGIPVKKKLEGVGQNLLDHFGVHTDYSCQMEHSLLSMIKRPTMLLQQIYEYWKKSDGWFIAPLVEVVLFANSSLVTADGTLPRLSAAQLDSHDPTNLPDFEIMTSTIADPRFPGFDPSMGTMSLLFALLRPKSVGSIELRSLDPLDDPICDPRYLSNEDDFKVFRAALRVGMRMADGMRAQGYPLVDVNVPKSEDDADLDAHIKRWSDTFFHYTSTCRMAPESDGIPGVVDDELRVHGVANLRIADASVFPRIPSAHPQAPVVMVAERCADFLHKKAQNAQYPI
ncbi:GMC oxidoreductase [Ramaria rubella]|nr:GMC oxidoreductase [Ramaria rubella]